MDNEPQAQIWPEAMPSIQPRGRDTIVLSSRIEVGSRRALYALSIPEYIEAWLRAPDPEEVLVFAFVTPVRFQVDLYREDALRASIHASAHVVNKTEVIYRWQTISPYAITHTMVNLVLCGGLDQCVVGLKHSGFSNMREQAWHYELWKRSMEKLSRIIATH